MNKNERIIISIVLAIVVVAGGFSLYNSVGAEKLK